jgi:hypothetical protein
MADPFDYAWMEDDDDLGMDGDDFCDHLVDYGRQRKFDGGRCPLLCSRCRLIIGYWGVAEGGTLSEGPYKYSEYICVEHPYSDGGGNLIEYEVEREPDPQEGQGLW